MTKADAPARWPVCGVVTAAGSRRRRRCLFPLCSRFASVGMSLAQVAQDGRGCPGPGLDGGFGIEGAEVITGEMDTCCRAGEGCLDAAPAREAVCETERPPA